MAVGIILGTILGGTICGAVVAIIYFYNQFTDITDEYDKLYGNYYRIGDELRDFKKRVYQLELDVNAIRNGADIPDPQEEK